MKKKQLLAVALTAVMLLGGCGGAASQTTAAGTKAAAATTKAASAAATTKAASAAATTKAASATTAKAAASGKSVTIKFANYALLEKGYEDFWNNVKKGFEEKNPDIKVEYVTAPYGEMVNQVVNMAGGGDKVDMVFGEIDWVPVLENAGITVPVSDILPADYLADFYPDVMKSFNIDGKPYGLPMYISPYVLFYNKDLFKQAGIDTPPATYDEMLKDAEKLSALKDKNGNKVYAFGQTTASVAVSGASLTGMIYNFGGTLLGDDGKLSIDNQGFTDAMNMLKTLNDKGYNPQNSKLKDLRNLFALGQLAMYYDQSWGFNGVKSINAEAANFAATTKPLKGGSGSGQSILQAHCLMYADNGKDKKDACSKFTQYLMTSEVLGKYMSDITPAYPAKKSMENTTLNPVLKGAAGSASNVKSQVFVSQIGDLYLELCKTAQAITVSGTDPAAAVKSFKTSAEGILSK
jgi:multiple sugar transport system substrate-binding protein